MIPNKVKCAARWNDIIFEALHIRTKVSWAYRTRYAQLKDNSDMTL